jgi:hypothetical protein
MHNTFKDPDAPEGSSSASPICLPWRPEDPGYDQAQVTKGTITGWGQVTNDKIVNKANYENFQAGVRYQSYKPFFL